MIVTKKQLGDQGEQLALEYIKNLGYKILAQNYRTPYGEIDIVAVQNNVTCFIEVKTRTSSNFGRPMDAITKYKLRNIQKSSEYYLSKNPNLPKACSIDVIEIYANDNNEIKFYKKIDM